MVTMSRGIYERFNGATETSEDEDKKLITFDGNYIQVFYEKDPKVICWNTTMEKEFLAINSDRILTLHEKIPDVIDWNTTGFDYLAAADSCDPPSGVPTTEHSSTVKCELIDSMNTVPREDMMMTTDGITVAGINDCWISADETTGKRLLTTLKGEKPETNVRNLFFELHFWSLFQIGMEKRHNTQDKKQKPRPTNKKHAHRSQQQPLLQTHELDNTELNSGVDKMLEEGKYNDLTDGRYEKTIYVKTWKDKTITVKINLKHTVENVKGQIEEKTKNPERAPASREQKKGPDGQKKKKR